MVHIEHVLLSALGQSGDRYIFGAETQATDANPEAFDCSELVEWACARAGVLPRVPDGAYYQWRHCTDHGLRVTVPDGIATRGALLFVGDGTGVGRDAITHVAWSLGDGTTIEARGSRWGVGTWSAAGRFNFAALIPGVDYGARDTEDDIMSAEAEQKIAEIHTLLTKNRKSENPLGPRIDVAYANSQAIPTLTAQVAALRETVRQLAGGTTVVDYAKVEAAAEKAMRDVLGTLDGD